MNLPEQVRQVTDRYLAEVLASCRLALVSGQAQDPAASLDP